jgi:hypothetical protein
VILILRAADGLFHDVEAEQITKGKLFVHEFYREATELCSDPGNLVLAY